MAYNNGFPVSYGQMYPQQIPQMQAPIQPSYSDSPFLWVQGEAGAKSFLVAPNKTVELWDTEAQTIYLKSADASGMPSMKILDYTIREQNTPQKAQLINEGIEYVTKEELTAFKDEITRKMEELSKEALGA